MLCVLGRNCRVPFGTVEEGRASERGSSGLWHGARARQRWTDMVRAFSDVAAEKRVPYVRRRAADCWQTRDLNQSSGAPVGKFQTGRRLQWGLFGPCSGPARGLFSDVVLRTGTRWQSWQATHWIGSTGTGIDRPRLHFPKDPADVRVEALSFPSAETTRSNPASPEILIYPKTTHESVQNSSNFLAV